MLSRRWLLKGRVQPIRPFIYEKAAGLNYVASYINLGVLSYQVSGTPKDYDAARRWYEKAVAANDPAGLNADAAPRAVREDRRLIGDDPP
jgi:hypothetical protein